MTTNENHRSRLDTLPLLKGLPEADRGTIINGTPIIALDRGQPLFWQGDDADFIPVCLDGWLVVFRDNAEGERTVVHVVHAGESFGEPAALGLGRFPASAEAASEVIVAKIPAQAISDRIAADGTLGLKVISSLSFRLRQMVEEMERRSFLSTDARLAAFLCDLTDKQTGSETIRLPFDKGLVAARLGMKPESLSRAIAKLKPAGVLSKGADIIVEDMVRLRILAGEEPD